MTNSLIVHRSRDERLKVMIEMRLAGKSLDEISERVGVVRGWVCKLLQRSGTPVPDITFDKRGSARTKHGLRKDPIYYSWYSMKTRCGNPNHADYPNWGGRGITYDPAWECFANFYADMGPRPSKEFTLERIDNERGYSKDNCRWALKRHQNRNMRSTVLNEEQVLTIRRKFSEGMRQFEIAKEYGIRPSHVASIVKRKCLKDI